MRRRSALVMAVVLPPLLALAGCGGAPGVAPAGAMPASVRVPPPPPPSGGGVTAPPAIADPAGLKGLSVRQVQAVLGSPAFKRRDAPAEIWQYRGRLCTLDLFIYDDGKGQQVEHYTVRSVAPVADKDCFDELLGRSAPGS